MFSRDLEEVHKVVRQGPKQNECQQGGAGKNFV